MNKYITSSFEKHLARNIGVETAKIQVQNFLFQKVKFSSGDFELNNISNARAAFISPE